jgi:hypothetical protein
VQVRIFFLLSVMPTRAGSERSRLMRELGSLLGLTDVGYLRKPTLFYGEECVLDVR